MTSSTSTNGVTVAHPLPILFGNILESQSGQDMVERSWKYNVPVAVGSFYTYNNGSSQDACGATFMHS